MKTKFNLDRKPLDSDYIASKQDFEGVQKGIRQIHQPIWKRPWFYGPTGAAAFALILSMTIFNEDVDTQQSSKIKQAGIAELEDTPCILPLSETLDLAFEVYKCQAGVAKEIQTNNGSLITIPKEAFAAYEGEIEIKVRTFSTKEEAFRAGVPMDFEKDAFESAGMIELRGFQNGEEVTISKDAPLTVKMNTHKDPSEVPFWFLNEETKKWEDTPCISRTNTTSSSNESEGASSNESEVLRAEAALKEVGERIESNVTKQSGIKNELSQIESLLPQENSRKINVQYNPSDYPELKKLGDLNFEYVNYTTAIGERLRQGKWSNIDLTESNQKYFAVFSNNKEDLKVEVRPVLSGMDLATYKAKIAETQKEKTHRLIQLQEERLKLEKERKEKQLVYENKMNKLKAELAAYRSPNESASRNQQRAIARQIVAGSVEFRTTQFGLFNSDNPIPYPIRPPVPYELRMANGQELIASQVFVFDNKKDCRFSYGTVHVHDISEFNWNHKNSTILVVDKEGRLYIQDELSNPEVNQVLTVRLLNIENLDEVDFDKILQGKTTVV